MKRNRDRTEVRNSSPQRVGDIFNAFLKNSKFGRAYKEWDVVENWGRIAGERVSKVTESAKVEKSILYIKVASAPWRQELSYMKEMLMESIVRETGCKTIKDIVFL